MAPCVTVLKPHAKSTIQCAHLVLGLRALLLAAHRYAGGDVLDAHGRLHLIDVLAASAPSSHCRDLKVSLGDVDLFCFVTCRFECDTALKALCVHVHERSVMRPGVVSPVS